MSTETESYLAELETVEQEANAFLNEADPEGQDRGLALTRQLRATVKPYRRQIDTIRAEARAEARQELITERQAESSFRRLGVPPSGRALFADLDPTDFEAMQQRANELREAGISWPGQPEPAGPPPPDPRQVAIEQMQQASAGGLPLQGDLASRMRDMEANPHKYSDAQHVAIVEEYNQAVTRAGMHSSAGARG